MRRGYSANQISTTNRPSDLPEIKKAFESLSVALDNDPALRSTVDPSFIDHLTDWKKYEVYSHFGYVSLTARSFRGNESLLSHVRLAVYGSKEVYNLRTKQAIDERKKKAVPISGSDIALLDAEPAVVLDGKPESYLADTKNWALFKDNKTNNLYFSVRGTSTSGISAVIDNITNLDAKAWPTDEFDTKASLSGKIIDSSLSRYLCRKRIKANFKRTEAFCRWQTRCFKARKMQY